VENLRKIVKKAIQDVLKENYQDKNVFDESSYTNTHGDLFWGDVGCGVFVTAHNIYRKRKKKG
jgi:hypothetical protein